MSWSDLAQPPFMVHLCGFHWLISTSTKIQSRISLFVKLSLLDDVSGGPGICTLLTECQTFPQATLPTFSVLHLRSFKFTNKVLIDSLSQHSSSDANNSHKQFFMNPWRKRRRHKVLSNKAATLTA